MTGRAAVDIGGTFTDLIAVVDGELRLEKVPTTPENFADGVVNALGGVEPGRLDQFVHGTTVVINAITERTGDRVALLTTEGFRDVLDVTRANRPAMFDFRYRKPEPFVPRRDRWPIPERIDAAGEVIDPLDEAAVRRAAREIREAGIESVAVSFVNAYVDPTHERRTGELLTEEHPDAVVTLSHELTREYREYERTNTAALNAYVRPTATAYLTSLSDRLDDRGVSDERYAMKSNAGITRFEDAHERPIELVESGPVGCVLGAARLGERIGRDHVISFDMGGTTAKASPVEDGEVSIETEYWLQRTDRWEGYPLKVPVIDIVEIGAGGGSIAWIDDDGSLRVGPKSAGANPGPACYGWGGQRPTVTDADLVTGRLNPDYFLDGEMSLDVERARTALEPIANYAGTSIGEAARGVIRLVDANMTNVLKQVSVERGHDPRDFVLVASGGAGGLHAPTLGRELGVAEVVVPRAPGEFSAWGMLQTDLRYDYIRTDIRPFDPNRAGDLADTFAGMAAEARESFAAERNGSTAVTVERYADLRYLGQEHTVTVPVRRGDGSVEMSPDAVGDLDAAEVKSTLRRFHDRHEQAYNFRLDDPVEVVDLRLTATVEVAPPARQSFDGGEDTGAALVASRPVDFGDGFHETDVYRRERLPAGAALDGPVVVEEASSTTIVHPDQRARVDEYGNLRIQGGDSQRLGGGPHDDRG